MGLIQKNIKISLVGLFVLLIAGYLFSYAFAIKYNLEKMTVTVPNLLKITSNFNKQGEKFFELRYEKSNGLFGTVGYSNIDTTPASFDRAVQYLAKTTPNYQEIKRGCNDGLLSIQNNYCAVKYYGDGVYMFQVKTQITDGLSAIWTFGSKTIDVINLKIPIAAQIINTMQPDSSSGVSGGPSDFGQQRPDSSSGLSGGFGHSGEQKVLGTSVP
jgi:hypothetical protein